MNSSQKTLLLTIGAIIIGGFSSVIIRFMGPFLSSLMGVVPVVGAYILAVLLVLVSIAVAVILKSKLTRAVIVVIAMMSAVLACAWTEDDTRGYAPCGGGYFVRKDYSFKGWHHRYINRFGIREIELDYVEVDG